MSLIESCLSVAMISVVTVMAVPALQQSRQDYELTSAARDVASKLQFARIRAVSRNIDCRLRVTSSVSYAVECQDPVWALASAVVLPRGMTIAANARPEFHRLGNVAPTATITLTNAANRQKKVIVNNGGRIRVQ
jgi:Tfp pilus assembly protein FimT